MLIVATLVSALLSSPAAPSSSPTERPAAETTDVFASAFAAIPADPPPATTTRGEHYWIGNEDRLDLFYTDVQNKHGIHMGVGAEQNWVLCGWSRCDALVLMDFDQAIVDLHRVYVVAFALAPTRRAFLDLWLDRSRKGLRAGIITRYGGREALAALKALDVARWSIERRFTRLEDGLTARGVPSFLTDDAQYAWLHELVVRDRVVTVRGDLTAKKTVLAIAAAATRTGLPVRTLYLSNAEQYFSYNKQTRKNLTSLPLDAEGLVLRTHGSKALGHAEGGNRYHYGTQTAASLTAFLSSTAVTSSHQILQWATTTTEPGRSLQASTAPTAAREAWLAAKKSAGSSTKKKPT
ncbi:MAG TPA: hypothetical protein VGF99_21200 [Myxococcota bacterium]